MISILSQAYPASAVAPPKPEPVELSSPDAQITETESTDGEFEWVVGSGQMAALAFITIAGIALFSGISFLAGKATAAQAPALPVIELKLPQPPAPPPPSIGEQFESSAAATPTKVSGGPIFADPAVGKNYIQMAAVEKPVAAIFAEGLRSHGLSAFVAPGATPNIYRVLIGPVSDIQAYTAAKVELDKIGLATFMRQYQK